LDFTIIGGGASGTATLLQLARALSGGAADGSADPGRFRVRVVEREGAFGPGFPHADRNALPFHLINMCARDMGVLDGRPEDFQDWLDERRPALARDFPGYRPFLESPWLRDGPCTYVPRGVMGVYLEERFRESADRLRRIGASVTLLSGWEAEDLREEGGALRVFLRRAGGGETRVLATDRVLLATGHWFDATPDGRFFPSPWPPRSLAEAVPPGARVGVIGTSLSALDAALTLTADGAFARGASGGLAYRPSGRPRSITLYSRSGLLPRVRGRAGPYRNVHFTRAGLRERRLANGGVLFLEDLYELLDADLRRCYGRAVDWKRAVRPRGTPQALLEGHLREARRGDGPGGELRWQTVLHQTFPMAREIYLQLSPADRERFDRELTTPFFLFASPMPPANAEKLLALMRAGVVRVVRLGSSYSFDRGRGEPPFVFRYEDPEGRTREEPCSHVVDARGQKRSFETNPAPLAGNLLASGTVRIETLHLPGSANRAYKTGAVWIDPETHRVMQGSPGGPGRISSRIYAMGAPTRGQILDASMAHSCAHAAAVVVRDLLRSLSPPQQAL
jgi:uncharacterized NAD(P)/FAD-binding protein YdhS